VELRRKKRLAVSNFGVAHHRGHQPARQFNYKQLLMGVNYFLQPFFSEFFGLTGAYNPFGDGKKKFLLTFTF